MSKVLTINNVGYNQVSSDLDPSNLPANAISSGLNFRAIRDCIESYNGHTQLYAPSSGFEVGALDVVVTSNGSYYVLLGKGAVKVFDGISWYDITTADLIATPMSSGEEQSWVKTKLGSIPIYNNVYHYPVYWSPQSTSQVLQYLKFDATNTWKAKNYRCAAIRAHKNFLFALNLTEGSTELPYSYRWSHPADINGLPPSWDDTDISYIASKEQIAGSGGNIIDGRSIGGSFCIYSASAINILDYTGGEFVWANRNLSAHYGLLSLDCVTDLAGINYFITDGDILRNDGNSLESILDTKMRRAFAASLSSSNYANCKALSVPNKSEVWFFIVEEGSTLPSIIYIYNVLTNIVSVRSISNMSAAAYGVKFSGNDSWDSAVGSWDTEETPWNNSTSPFNSEVLSVGQSNSAVYTLDSTSTSYDTVLERTDLSLTDELDKATTIVNVYPKIHCDGLVNFRLGSQRFVGDDVTWKTAVTFDPRVQRKISLRSTGKLHAWKLSSIGADKFKFYGMSIEFELAGSR